MLWDQGSPPTGPCGPCSFIAVGVIPSLPLSLKLESSGPTLRRAGHLDYV